MNTADTNQLNETAVIGTIIEALQQLNLAQNSDALTPETSLDSDLHLDSVSILNLMVSLEIDYNLPFPEDIPVKQTNRTIRSLAHLLLKNTDSETQPLTPAVTEPQAFEDIKVHCFVSCLCEMIKENKDVDHRPFYFGVWNAETIVDENYTITNHSDTINHDFYREWFEKLYGVSVRPWYDSGVDRTQNLHHLQWLLRHAEPDESIMVMLDLSKLPERENRFNKDPFPHYVMLQEQDDPEAIFMYDPDFRWEGSLNRKRVWNAIAQPSVGGGYLFDRREIRRTDLKVVCDYFQTCICSGSNPLTEAIRSCLNAHVEGRSQTGAPIALSHLTAALHDVPLLAIRKYAYEHAFAYFHDGTPEGDPIFEAWCTQIAKLVERYTDIQFEAMKLATSFNEKRLQTIHTRLNEQDELEHKIKQGAILAFNAWRERNRLGSGTNFSIHNMSS